MRVRKGQCYHPLDSNWSGGWAPEGGLKLRQCFRLIFTIEIELGVFTTDLLLLLLLLLLPDKFVLLFPLLQVGGPLPGPKSGLLSNTWEWVVWGDTRTDRAKDFIGKGCLDREQRGKWTQESCYATWLTVSGFMVTGLVSGLSLATHLAWPIFGLTQGPSWWQMHLSAKIDFSAKDSGRLGDFPGCPVVRTPHFYCRGHLFDPWLGK